MGFFKLLMLIVQIVAILVPLLLAVAYYTYAERRIIGFIQDRVGPNRVGPFGLFQPFADGIKVLFKEVLIPKQANGILHLFAPVFVFAPALAAWAVMPFSNTLILAPINLGILYILAISSLGIYGILIAGWATNSKYALLGAIRAAAQLVSYEIAMGFAIMGVVLASGSLDLNQIIRAQQGGFWNWFMWPLFPLFGVYWISAIAEINRTPFDLAEGESEIVAGFHVEYSGMPFSIFFLAEYANMLLVSAIASSLFLGGWLSPFQGIWGLAYLFSWVPGLVWFGLKIGFFATSLIWLRATVPRFRYDQVMRLGWKFLIPVSIVWVIVVGGLVWCRCPPWFQ